jgi:hypothetical protein
VPTTVSRTTSYRSVNPFESGIAVFCGRLRLGVAYPHWSIPRPISSVAPGSGLTNRKCEDSTRTKQSPYLRDTNPLSTAYLREGAPVAPRRFGLSLLLLDTPANSRAESPAPGNRHVILSAAGRQVSPRPVMLRRAAADRSPLGCDS